MANNGEAAVNVVDEINAPNLPVQAARRRKAQGKLLERVMRRSLDLLRRAKKKRRDQRRKAAAAAAEPEPEPEPARGIAILEPGPGTAIDYAAGNTVHDVVSYDVEGVGCCSLHAAAGSDQFRRPE